MTGPLYPKVADGFGVTLAGVAAGQWHEPTPCTDWDVEALVVHVIETHRRVRSMVQPDLVRDPVEGGDYLALWSEATADIRAILADPVLAATEVTGRSGPRPFSSLVEGLLSIDTLCHTWDLARATGREVRLDPDAVAMAHGALESFGDAMRVPGGFGAPVEPAPDADAQTRFLNFAGRAT